MKGLAVLTVVLLLLGSVIASLLPAIGVTGLAILLGVPFRLAWYWALLVGCGIFILWFVVSTKLDTVIRAALKGRPAAAQELVTNVASFVLLWGGYAFIVESPWAALLMAAMVFCLYLALRPLIDKLDAATEARQARS